MGLTVRSVLQERLPPDAVEEVLRHRAASIIQSFIRRSVFFVEVRSEEKCYRFPNYQHAGKHVGGRRQITKRKTAAIPMRGKPLGIALRSMLSICMHEKLRYRYRCQDRKRRGLKRTPTFSVHLFKRVRCALHANLPVSIIKVTHDSRF